MTIKKLLYEIAKGEAGKRLEKVRIPLPFGFAIYPFDSKSVFSDSSTYPEHVARTGGIPDSEALYRRLDEGPKTKALEDSFRKAGLDISYTTFDDLTDRYGKDGREIHAWRSGDKAEIGIDYRGVPNSPARIRALLAHEYGAGHNHARSDREAQDYARSLLEYLGDDTAVREVDRIDTEVFRFKDRGYKLDA